MLADAEAACRAGAFGLFVPKTRHPSDLIRLDEHLDKIERGRPGTKKTLLVPMIEDPGAVLDARALATATPRTFGLITGGEDLATAMGAEPTPEVLRFPKLLVHLAAKAAGVLSFGLLRSVADYRDLEGIQACGPGSPRLRLRWRHLRASLRRRDFERNFRAFGARKSIGQPA